MVRVPGGQPDPRDVHDRSVPGVHRPCGLPLPPGVYRRPDEGSPLPCGQLLHRGHRACCCLHCGCWAVLPRGQLDQRRCDLRSGLHLRGRVGPVLDVPCEQAVRWRGCAGGALLRGRIRPSRWQRLHSLQQGVRKVHDLQWGHGQLRVRRLQLGLVALLPVGPSPLSTALTAHCTVHSITMYCCTHMRNERWHVPSSPVPVAWPTVAA